MRLYKKQYDAVDLTDTTTAEAIGIIWTAVAYRPTDGLDIQDQEEYDRCVSAIFEEGECGDVWRIDEKEFNDNLHRDDEWYCVRIHVTVFADEMTDETHDYVVSISAPDSFSPKLEVHFARQIKDGNAKMFTPIATIVLGNEYIQFMMKKG